jgi:molecular chaperone GrpE
MNQETPQAEAVSTGNGAAEETPEIAAATAAEDLAARLEVLRNERDALEAKAAELNDLLLRRTAEFDNYRKRTERERLELGEYAAADAVKALLPVLDDLERALKVETKDAEYAKGVELIYTRLFEILKKLGLEPLESLGQPFDPNFHHAIELVETTEAEDQTVIDELMRGYTFKGRLLRAAMVRVASRS